jgi:fucose 4-O-acetylase-like acetyltransferase
MTRRLLLLNGLAILAVICHHAALRTFDEVFLSTGRYFPDTTTNYNQMGSLSYYALLVVIKLTLFSVPAFLFVSGFFIAYAARGSRSDLSWKMIRVRIINLLVPYLIWSLIIFFGLWLQSCVRECQLDTLSTYLAKLALGKADPIYWYIIVICQLYLLAPLLIPVAKIRWRLLLLIAALIQFSASAITYLEYFNVEMPLALRLVATFELFTNGIFYFVFGIVIGFHLQEFKEWLDRLKWGLLVIAVIAGIMSVVEEDFLFQMARYIGTRETPLTALYVITFILSYLAFEKVDIPQSKMVYQIGSKTFGLYLLHNKVQGYILMAAYSFVPTLLTYQILLQPILIALGLGIPLLFMSFVAKSQLRGMYRYLFG